MFKSPMLAKDYDESQLAFPLDFSVKLDGWRAVIHDGQVKTRSGKLVRNVYTQMLFGRVALEGLDGELVVGNSAAPDVFNKTDAALKKAAGEPDVIFYVFDLYDAPEGMSYYDRRAEAQKRIDNFNKQISLHPELHNRVVLLPSKIVYSIKQLEDAEMDALEVGYEGGMLRDINSPYKYGRSTVREGYLLKVKRPSHAEAIVLDVKERMINNNEAFINELGRTKRSSHAENRVPSGMAGSIIVQSKEWGEKEFSISTGYLNDEEKRWLLENKEAVKGQQCRFKYLAHGVKDVPRHGRFDGWRAPEDSATVEGA